MKKGKKITAVLTACMVLTAAANLIPTSVCFAEGKGNIIKNSTFDNNAGGWDTYLEPTAKATLRAEDGKLALHISSLGKVNYAVQAFYDIIPLYKNGVYHIHYEISSTTPRTIEGMIQQNGGDYTAYTWQKLPLTEEPLVIDYDFTMKYDTDIMTKLVFNCGVYKGEEDLPEHTIYLDNVTLELIDDSAVDYSAGKPYAPPILTNQLGYRTNSKKTAVVRKDAGTDTFTVVSAADHNDVVYTGKLSAGIDNPSAKETDYIADFSEVKAPGEYCILCGDLDASYTFTVSDDPYTKLLDESVRMLYLQRCGCAIEDTDFSHPACHTELATIYGTNEKIDVSGGWHDAGDYGRYVVPAAKSIADLLYAYQQNPALYSDSIGIPESGNGTPDILDEARYELEWMLKMQAADGGVYHKVTCETFPGYVMPEEETAPLIVTPVSSTATANFCASMALAAEFYADVDADFAAKCADAAKKAWNYLQQHPEFNFKNPSDISTGDYGDKSDKDERYWAAAQMYRAFGEEYLPALESMGVQTGLDWATVGDYGNIALVTMKGIDKESAVYTKAKDALVKQAGSFSRVTQNSPYGSPITKYNWGSNMTIANAGIVMALAYQLTGEESYLSDAEATLHYLLGENPLGSSFVTGFGTVSPEHPHHRPSMNVGKAMPGMLVGGVNSSLEDSAAKAYCAEEPAAKCWVDNSESYSTNEITIYWNSPLTYLLTLTGEKAPAEQTEANGDVNADGTTDLADAVALQKYLTTESAELANWTAGDLNADGKLTATDLTLMKWDILS